MDNMNNPLKLGSKSWSGKEIRKFRDTHKFPRWKFAKLLNISFDMLNKWEREEFRIPMYVSHIMTKYAANTELMYITIDDWTTDSMREFREIIGYNQEKMSELFGVNRVTYWNWEKGNTKIPGPAKVLLQIIHNDLLSLVKS